MARFITTAERVGMMKGRVEGRYRVLQQGMQRMAEIIIRILRLRFIFASPSF